jgi:hypothetical protein
MGKLAISPSTAAKMPNLIDQQKKRPVLNGRPADLSGLPIQLYHPVFSAFDEFMQSSDVLPDAADYATAHTLLVQSAALYPKEEMREEVLLPLLRQALHKPLQRIVNANGTKSDFSYTVNCEKHLDALAFLGEQKNEIGTGGCDPSVQAGFSYRQFWTEDRVRLFSPHFSVLC